MLAVQTLVSMGALAVPAIAPAVAAATALPLSAVGVFSATLYVGAMLAAINAGFPVLRLGAVRMAQICLAVAACGLLLVATAQPALMLPGALLVGFGYGSATPASSHLFAYEVPARWRGLVFSIKQTGVPLGGMLAGALLPSTAQRIGWRMALPLLALACVGCAGLLQPLRERFDRHCDGTQRFDAWAWRRTLGIVWGCPPVRELAVCTLFFASMQASLATYLVAQAHAGAGLGPVRAGLLLAAAQAAGVVGRIIWGWASDHWVSPSRMLALLALAMGLCALLTACIAPEWPTSGLFLLAMLFGATATGWNGVYLAEVARLAPPGMAGVLTGGTLFFTFCGAFAGPSAFAAVAAATRRVGDGYLVLGCVLAVLGLLLLWRRRRRQT
jgi:MFS family permease